MMFDPPDYPYKELSDTLRDHYDSDYLLFNSDTVTTDPVSNMNKDLADAAEQMISNVGNQIVLSSTQSLDTRESVFENTNSSSNTSQNTELYIVQSDHLLNNYEPTLLDENTVNQFLLPPQISSESNKNNEDTGPDLLALHSCVICHEIFITEADLLDHTISFHASVNDLDAMPSSPSLCSRDNQVKIEEIVHQTDLDFDSYWLVCSVCERVLSTALEIAPTEQLCCTTSDGKSNVSPKKLHTMYVCDFCNGLFADADALDRHRSTCYEQDQSQTMYAQKKLQMMTTTIESMACNGSSTEKAYVQQQQQICHFSSTLSFDPSSANGITNECSQLCCACDHCDRRFTSIEELKLHVVQCLHNASSKKDRRPYAASTSKMWNCGSCNQLFTTARELYKHKRGEDRPSGAPLMAYVCEECDKVLGSMCALHTHKKMHKVTKPGYPCRVCGRRFNQSGHLAIHMRMHTGERPYPCDLCPKAFKVKVERDDHRRTHTGERPFACAACPKTFTAAARLREHARIHTDQRPYRCDICGAAFRRPYARTVHTLIHTGEKPHECDVCGTSFRRSGDMWKHKRTLHGIQATSSEIESKS